MKHILKPIALTGVAVAIAFLSLRGGVAIYKQLTTNPAAVSESSQATSSPIIITSKAERMARAKALLAGMGKDGIVSEVFSATDGSTGVVIRSGEGAFIGWMLEGVDALFVGAKFDREGNNRTQMEMLARQFAQPSAVSPVSGSPGANQQAQVGQSTSRLLASINQSAGFIEGSAGPIITAYIDTNCTFCTQLWRNLRAPITAGQIRVRWAPVAIIAPDSRTRATTLLQSSRPLDVLAEHGQSGRPIPASPENQGVNQALDANNAMLKLLSANQSPATPTLVVNTASGEPVIVRGLPPNLSELLAQAR